MVDTPWPKPDKVTTPLGATAQIAAFCTSTQLRDVPARALSVAKAGIVDALACAVAARDEPAVVALREHVESEGGEASCRLWATELRAPGRGAALVNGTAAHALDFDDVCWAMNGHPSTVILPAALAAAEIRRATGSFAGAALGADCPTGADLLLAYVTGFEVAGRIGEALGSAHYERGWHPTATLGLLGATVAAGRLLGLDLESLPRALGIACSAAAGSRMNFGTDTKPLHAGRAAEGGLVAAQLAARGLTARRDGLEASMGFLELYGGSRDAPVRTTLDSFVLERPGLELKPYPSCRFTHRVIDGVLALRARSAGRELSRLECDVDPFALRILLYPEPHTGLEAKFSMPYCAAVAWADGLPTVDAFRPDVVARADLRALVQRVQVRPVTAERETVTAHYSNGTSDRETVRLPLGHPENPMSDAQREEKVLALVRPVLGERAARELIRIVADLEHCDDIRLLSDCLGGSA